MVCKVLKKLIHLKKAQIEALQIKDFKSLEVLEEKFEQEQQQVHIAPKAIDKEVVRDLHELNLLNHKLLVAKSKNVPAPKSSNRQP